MRKLSYKSGLGMGLLVAGWLVFALIVQEAPHLVWTAGLAGLLAGCGMGLGSWDFLEQPSMSQIKAEIVKKRRRLIITLCFVCPLGILGLWLSGLNWLFFSFFSGMIVALAIISVVFFPTSGKEKEKGTG